MQKTIKNNIIFVDKPKMSLVPLVLSAASLFFVVLGAASLFYLQAPLQEVQNIQDQASIGGGTVILTSELASSAVYTPGAPTIIDLKYNSQGAQLSGLQILVKVKADSETPTIEVPTTSNIKAIYQEVDDPVDGERLISMIIATNTIGDNFSSTTPTTFARLSVPLRNPGTIQLSYDKPQSIATIASLTDDEDQLRTPVDVTFTITDASASATPTATPAATPTVINDDFYPQPGNNAIRLTFYTDNDAKTEVALADLKAYQTYKVKISYTVQNNKKSTETDLRPILSAFVFNGQGNSYASSETAYHLIASARDGGSGISPETRFTALPNNELRFTVDANNAYTETNEGNNVLNYRFTAANSTTTTTAACNQYCADSRGCAANYTCFFNRCRRADNPDNASCSAPTAAVTQTIAKGCNIGCSTNKECGINLRCYNGACRLATNPSSLSCSATTARVVGRGAGIGGPGSKGEEIPLPSVSPAASGSPRATATVSATPRASATVLPTGTPRVTPVASPAGTATNTDQSLFVRILNVFQSRGISLPILAVGLGLILFVVALILALLNRGRRDTPPTVINQRKDLPITPAEDELQKKINALKSGVTAGPSVRPVPPPKPLQPVVPTPVNPTAARQSVVVNTPTATPVSLATPQAPSMISRLKDRGVMDTVGKTKTD